MKASRIRSLLAAGLICATAAPGLAIAQDAADLAPYTMLRSLQFVQDSVVLGDHSAGEMQRFMLGTFDKRRRGDDLRDERRQSGDARISRVA
jgi:chemotaxis protein MotC